MHLRAGLFTLFAILAISPITESVSKRPGVGTHEQGSLRGVLKALERRRRASSGPYSLASYQDHDDSQDMIDYLEPNGRNAGKSYYNYLNKDDYPSDDVDSYKGTVFRERSDQMKEQIKSNNQKRGSAFREREAKQTDDLQDIFLKKLVEQEQEEEEREEANAEYAEILRRLWEKYKYTHPDNEYDEPTVPGPYRERNIRKRQIPGDYVPSGSWGPIAFKRKRSSKQRVDVNDNPDFLYSLKFVSQSDPAAVENLKDDKLVDEEQDPDISKIINVNPESRYEAYERNQNMESDEEPKLGLQPLNYPEDEVFLPDGGEIIESPVGSENSYPINKRSNPAQGFYRKFAKRNLGSKSRSFRSTVTDPKIVKDLSSIFGEPKIDKPVKRSSNPEESSHEFKSPTVTALSHHQNETHQEHGDHENHDHPHSRHEHENKPPLLSSSDHSHEGDEKVTFGDDEETHIKLDHPIILKKKSIDWSKYFGIDRRKKSLNNGNAYVEKAKYIMDSMGEDVKRNPKLLERYKLDKADKLKNFEKAMINEALDYEGNESLDTKEEQEMKEKILSRLAAAYSLDKMRKALKDFKLNMQIQKDVKEPIDIEDKEKRTKEADTKRELDAEDINALEDNLFENEQGAGHFLNGPVEVMSEGYVGKNLPNKGLLVENGACPILDRIVRKCHNIDILAGDHGQLFLPLCSLHQICYLCGFTSPTGCDLMFLSEADSACGNHANCQKAARGALMALRDLHAPSAHSLQGQCSKDSCLTRPLQGKPWHQSFRR